MKDIPGGTSADVTSRYDLGGRRTFARFGATLTPSNDCAANNTGVDYCYDTVGRLLYETSYGRRLEFQYDQASNRIGSVYHTPAGAAALTVNYTYDALNRVDQVRENGATSGPGVLADYAYDAQSRRISLARGNGAVTTYGYTNASRLANLAHDLSGTANDGTWAYSYTPAGQLSGRSLVQVYEWSVPGLEDAYVRNGLNQYTNVDGAAFSYDARGNLTNDGARTLTYDLENRLVAVSGSTSGALEYDPLGRLRSYTAGGATTLFVYDGDRLVAEYNTSGALLRRYVHGPGVDEPLVWYEGATLADRRWLITDRQGSVIAATDASGTLVGSVYRYGPYGEPDTWSGSRFRYTGQFVLPELQLYHYKARVYSPLLGRFLQTDPVGYEDELHLYQYAANDPVNKVDPTGEWVWVAAGAIINAGVQAYSEHRAGTLNSWEGVGRVAVAAAVGAVGGGAAGTIGRQIVGRGIAAITARAAANAAVGGVTGAVQTETNARIESGGETGASPEQLGSGALQGAAFSAGGSAAGDAAGAALFRGAGGLAGESEH